MKKKPPKSLIEAYKKIYSADWESEELYEKYRQEVEKHLGKKKSKDRAETGKLLIDLYRIVNNIGDGEN